jgi:adenylate cyclase
MKPLERVVETLKRLRKGRAIILVFGVMFSLLMIVLALQHPLFFRFLDNKLYDTFLRSVHHTQTSGIPVIVDIDEKSLAQYGQFPWPRYRMARLLEKIKDLGAASVGLDIVFPEHDRTSLGAMQKELDDGHRVKLNLSNIPKELLDNDSIFAQSLASGPFVLGYFFNIGGQHNAQGQECELRVPQPAVRWPAGWSEKDLSKVMFASDTILCNIPILSHAAGWGGYINSLPDIDGIIRRVPLLIAWRGKLYPNLALAAYLRAKDSPQYALDISSDSMTLILGDAKIPLDDHAQLLINFRGPRNSFPYYSAADILQDKFPADTFKGKIVFVGTSATGLKDLRATPLDQIYPGVEAHANIVDNIIKKDFMQQPPWFKGVEILSILVFGTLSSLLLTWTSALWSLIPLFLCGIGLWRAAIWGMEQGMFISPLYSMLTLALNFSLLTLIKFWREESEKRFFHSAFSRYVSKAVVDQLVKSPEKLALSGEEREVTILFSDIRGFTTLSEQLPPSQVSELLHAYFTPMTHCVITHGGTMDKFIGDAIMAFWNAPLDTPGHQGRAVESAMVMLDELSTLNKTFKTKYGFELCIGIGLNCGSVRVGNMGSADLFDYTVIGDNVNLASRLEGLTKYYGLECIVSESIKFACDKEFFFQEIDKVRVKGKVLPIAIYAPHRRSDLPRKQAELDLYEEALELYKQQKFKAAQTAFEELREFSDKQLYAVYHQRCVVLAGHPPGADWDHVFTHEEK